MRASICGHRRKRTLRHFPGPPVDCRKSIVLNERSSDVPIPASHDCNPRTPMVSQQEDLWDPYKNGFFEATEILQASKLPTSSGKPVHRFRHSKQTSSDLGEPFSTKLLAHLALVAARCGEQRGKPERRFTREAADANRQSFVDAAKPESTGQQIANRTSLNAGVQCRVGMLCVVKQLLHTAA